MLSNTSIVSNPVVLINKTVQTVGVSYSVANNTVTFVTAPTANDIIEVCNYTITAENPVIATFVTAPPAGVQVTLLVRRGVDWYNPGSGTPSNGVSLQETDNAIARFLRGGN